MKVKFISANQIILSPESEEEKILLFNFSEYNFITSKASKVNTYGYDPNDKRTDAQKLESLEIKGSQTEQ